MKVREMRGYKKQAEIIFSFVLILALLGAAGCGKKETPPEEVPPAEAAKIEDYVTTVVGTVYAYEGFGNEYAAFTMTIDLCHSVIPADDTRNT